MAIKTLIVITLDEREVEILKLILPKAIEMFNLDDEEPDVIKALQDTMDKLLKKIGRPTE